MNIHGAGIRDCGIPPDFMQQRFAIYRDSLMVNQIAEQLKFFGRKGKPCHPKQIARI
jgi:hypothetical protein